MIKGRAVSQTLTHYHSLLQAKWFAVTERLMKTKDWLTIISITAFFAGIITLIATTTYQLGSLLIYDNHELNFNHPIASILIIIASSVSLTLLGVNPTKRK